MWGFIKPISLIRYLIVWRVSGSLVWLPSSVAAEISRSLGTMIAERLPTREASPWRKALAAWDQVDSDKNPQQHPRKLLVDASWPVESVIFVPPGKMAYGREELIVWELKLLGEDADHGLFLETILPAMEQAGTTSDPRWRDRYSLWGQFGLEAIYAARGNRWEPFVQSGQLDLRYRATPEQWAEELVFEGQPEHLFDRLTWITPFDLSTRPPRQRRGRVRQRRTMADHEMPTLQRILDALLQRMAVLLPGRHNTPADVLNNLDPEDRTAWEAAVQQATLIPVHEHRFHRPGRLWRREWIGEQRFPILPPTILPYLELASILHIGKRTHFGCGTFVID